MNEILTIYKPIGLTPLQLINKFKEKNPKYKDEKMAYAGRLDPMAHGLMILLVGDACKERDKYQGLDKEYEFEVIFGIESDSLDTLGIVSERDYDANLLFDNWNSDFKNIIKKLQGKIRQNYPNYSSYNVKGHPLYWWSRNNRLNEIIIPSKVVEICELNYLDRREINKNDLLKTIERRVDLVEGDFRQKEVLDSWQYLIRKTKHVSIYLFKFKAFVSSGTYIRELISQMGKELKTSAIAFDIKRIRVGEITLPSNPSP